MRQQHSGWRHLVWSDWCARLGFDSQTDHMTQEDKEVEEGLNPLWHRSLRSENYLNNGHSPCSVEELPYRTQHIDYPRCPRCFNETGYYRKWP